MLGKHFIIDIHFKKNVGSTYVTVKLKEAFKEEEPVEGVHIMNVEDERPLDKLNFSIAEEEWVEGYKH